MCIRGCIFIRNISKLVRFTSEEWTIVEERAKAANKKPLVFLRDIAVRGEVRIYDLEKYQVLLYPLRNIGNNINQIARVANSTGTVNEKDIADISAEQERLNDIFEEYFKGLEYKRV